MIYDSDDTSNVLNFIVAAYLWVFQYLISNCWLNVSFCTIIIIIISTIIIIIIYIHIYRSWTKLLMLLLSCNYQTVHIAAFIHWLRCCATVVFLDIASMFYYKCVVFLLFIYRVISKLERPVVCRKTGNVLTLFLDLVYFKFFLLLSVSVVDQ